MSRIFPIRIGRLWVMWHGWHIFRAYLLPKPNQNEAVIYGFAWLGFEVEILSDAGLEMVRASE